MALDYTQALRKRSQLDAATDAAVIAAVRPAMLLQTDAAAKATAAAVFASTGNTLSGLTSVPTPTITDAGLQRTVTVSYKASSTNNFPILLGSAVGAPTDCDHRLRLIAARLGRSVTRRRRWHRARPT
jgi:Flp pilus assembly protein TadG